MVLMGWADEELVEQGKYTFQKAALSGDPERKRSVKLPFTHILAMSGRGRLRAQCR